MVVKEDKVPAPSDVAGSTTGSNGSGGSEGSGENAMASPACIWSLCSLWRWCSQSMGSYIINVDMDGYGSLNHLAIAVTVHAHGMGLVCGLKAVQIV